MMKEKEKAAIRAIAHELAVLRTVRNLSFSLQGRKAATPRSDCKGSVLCSINEKRLSGIIKLL